VESIGLIGEEDIKAGQSAIAAGDVSLQLDLSILRQFRSVHLLLQYSQTVSQHHDFGKIMSRSANSSLGGSLCPDGESIHHPAILQPTHEAERTHTKAASLIEVFTHPFG
jgi:hypothetical protein